MPNVRLEHGQGAVPHLARTDSDGAGLEQALAGVVTPQTPSRSNRQNHIERLLSAVATHRLEHLGELQLRTELSRLIEELVTENADNIDNHEPEDLINHVLDECYRFGPISG